MYIICMLITPGANVTPPSGASSFCSIEHASTNLNVKHFPAIPMPKDIVSGQCSCCGRHCGVT